MKEPIILTLIIMQFMLMSIILIKVKKVSENNHSVVYCIYARHPQDKDLRVKDICLEYFKESK